MREVDIKHLIVKIKVEAVYLRQTIGKGVNSLNVKDVVQHNACNVLLRGVIIAICTKSGGPIRVDTICSANSEDR